ncbi:MAG: hypothetical protein ACXAB7_22710, partial [Candidatus Kariarchaeaceae archaeon]
MRLSLVVAITFTILFLVSNDPTSAYLGGNVETDTVLTIPPSISAGDDITIKSTTTFSSGPVFLGHTTFYYLSNNYVIGTQEYGVQVSLTDPTIEFTINNAMTLRVLKIPIISMSTDSVLSWFITETDGTVLADGEISVLELEDMQQQGDIMIAIGSLQSDDLPNDNKYSSGISLTTGSYRINMSQPTSFDYVAKASSTSQGTYAHDDGVVQPYYPQIQLFSGSHRERVATTNGEASTSFTVNQGTSYILAYYGDVSNFA